MSREELDKIMGNKDREIMEAKEERDRKVRKIRDEYEDIVKNKEQQYIRDMEDIKNKYREKENRNQQ